MSASPIRVVLVVTELRPAGAERIVYELASRLDRSRFEPAVLALWNYEGREGRFAASLRAAGVPVHLLRVRGKLDLLRVPPLVRTLRALAPRILHAHLFHANFVARLVAPLVGRPAVVSTHHVVERRQLGPRFVLDRATACLDDATVAVSDAVARFARETCGADPAKLRVVANGIDLSPFANERDPLAARRAFGLPEAGPLVGAVGRLDPQKGHGDLLRAWPAVRAAFPGATLAILGEGSLRGELEALARSLGVAESVRLLGHRPEVPEFLAALDLFVMPSRWEGFGLALAEALAAGKPCVVSDVDSLPGVLGGAGVLVPVRSHAALGEALNRLLGDPRERARLSGAARLRAPAFAVERMVADYEALYEELARARPRAD